MVDLALKTLLHDRTRFAITIAGVAFAVLLVLFQVGLFLGLLDNASVTVEHIDADLWVTSKNTPNVDFSHAFPESRVDRVRSVSGVARADNLIVSFLNIDLPSGSQESVITYALEDFERWGIPWGSWEGNLSDLLRGDYHSTTCTRAANGLPGRGATGWRTPAWASTSSSRSFSAAWSASWWWRRRSTPRRWSTSRSSAPSRPSAAPTGTSTPSSLARRPCRR